tara:strand:+ start:645 stop:1229 length:585 start_codon:yes stop_codon:yes gene_type:complete
VLKVSGDESDYSELPDRLGVDVQLLDQLTANISAHYRRFNIAKKAGGIREISAPSPALLRVQRKILGRILNKIPPHKAAKAYRSRYSIVRNARLHIGQPVLVKVDLKDFFGSIKSAAVERIFQEAGFKRHESAMLTALCCLNGALPQGAATSGYLSNLAMCAFDKKMMIICRQKVSAVASPPCAVNLKRRVSAP